MESINLNILEPFKLACESRSTKLMGVSLDCLQKLISTSLQNYPLEDPTFTHAKNNEKCINQVLKIICGCGLNPSDEIVLKVVQNILTAISSSYDIHIEHLFYAVRTCFHIYLSSNSKLNKTCARATLAQIVQVTFDRSKNFMKLFEQLLKTQKNNKELSNKKFSMINFEEIKMNSFSEDFITERKNKSDRICREIVIDMIRSKVLGQLSGKYGFCTVCNRSADHFCLQTKDSVCSMKCKIKNLSSIILYKETNPNQKHFLSIVLLTILYQNNCLLILRSLCSLANSNLDGIDFTSYNSKNEKPLKLQSKELSLDLILHILKGNSENIKKSKLFLDLIKSKLIGLLIQNVFEKNSNINGTTIAIFLELLKNFKTHLKVEIGVFLQCILIKIIESKNSNYRQKLICAVVFLKVCSSEQTLVDIFLNYDCNTNGFKIYQTIVSFIEKMTQMKLTVKDWINESQETQLKMIALGCFKKLFQSLLKWVENAIKIRKEKFSKNLGFNKKFNQKMEIENVLEKAIVKFNESPKMGINMLQSVGIIDIKSPTNIAEFLYKTPNLSKEAIGKYLGKSENEDILSAYVFLFEFDDLKIDIALKKFLNNFLLVGEGQIIDRIMSKFAVKYCYDNPNVFSSSDSAHLLSYSIIMLNTDLHSDKITNKMSRNDFVKNNKNVVKNEEIDTIYIENIYDRILKEEIRLDSNSEHDSNGYVTPKSRERNFINEEKEIKKVAERYVKTGQNSREFIDEFINADSDNIEIIFCMFESVWSSSLASLSILLDKSDDSNIVSVCLETYTCAIKLATFFKMDIIKEAYVNTLAGLTLLGTTKDMKPKNIMAIITILDIAHDEGNSLDKSWLTVLRCISNIEHLHLIGSGQTTDSAHFSLDDDKINDFQAMLMNSGFISQYSVPIPIETENDVNSKAVAFLIEQNKIDRIFMNSDNLNDDKILTFFKYLCKVSIEEINNESGSRIFILEKIVETTICNLHRNAKIWDEIWDYFYELFYNGGTVKNTNVGKYVINSFRVISTRFLSKKKFSEKPNIQKKVFKPLIMIMAKIDDFGIREIIIQCVFMLLQSVSDNLSAGWNGVFEIASIAAIDPRERICSAALNLVNFAKSKISVKNKTQNIEAFSGIFTFVRSANINYHGKLVEKSLEINFYVLNTFLKELLISENENIKSSKRKNRRKKSKYRNLAKNNDQNLAENNDQNLAKNNDQNFAKNDDLNLAENKNKERKSIEKTKFWINFGIKNILLMIFKENVELATQSTAINNLEKLLKHFKKLNSEIWTKIFETIFSKFRTNVNKRENLTEFENYLDRLEIEQIENIFVNVKQNNEKTIFNQNLEKYQIGNWNKRIFKNENKYVLENLLRIIIDILSENDLKFLNNKLILAFEQISQLENNTDKTLLKTIKYHHGREIIDFKLYLKTLQNIFHKNQANILKCVSRNFTNSENWSLNEYEINLKKKFEIEKISNKEKMQIRLKFIKFIEIVQIFVKFLNQF
ncbi:Brefeldin A-inhibited guanine nucleotide-exchange protein 1 [Bonamia ostreae]